MFFCLHRAWIRTHIWCWTSFHQSKCSFHDSSINQLAITTVILVQSTFIYGVLYRCKLYMKLCWYTSQVRLAREGYGGGWTAFWAVRRHRRTRQTDPGGVLSICSSIFIGFHYLFIAGSWSRRLSCHWPIVSASRLSASSLLKVILFHWLSKTFEPLVLWSFVFTFVNLCMLSDRRAALWASRHREDTDGSRVRCADQVDIPEVGRAAARADVHRRRREARARRVRAREGKGACYHLHRRARRHRHEALRFREGRRPRGAAHDARTAQPARRLPPQLQHQGECSPLFSPPSNREISLSII